jgi:hypothetical protein
LQTISNQLGVFFELSRRGFTNHDDDQQEFAPRDPEDRRIDENDVEEKEDKMMDKTIADTRFLPAIHLLRSPILTKIPSAMTGR